MIIMLRQISRRVHTTRSSAVAGRPRNAWSISLSHSRSLKVIRNDTPEWGTLFHCNYVSISYRFWDIQRQITAWPWNLGYRSLKVIENGTILKLGNISNLAYTCKALHTGQPPYLSELLQHYEPTRTLQSSSSFQLSVPRYNLEFGSRAFRISAPKIWNLLPASIRNSPSLRIISSASKNIIFSQPILTP